MDLRRARTFVTVADLGTVSEAALRLRVAQPALSRQISELEADLGLKLFDRLGRRLVLTGEGEQLLDDCRDLLHRAGAITERAEMLRQGDAGVLKVAASPQLIESVVSGFLITYAEHFPVVRVHLTEAMGWPEVMGLLERGEIHLGQNLAHAVAPGETRFGSHPLASVDLLAAFRPGLTLGRGAEVEIEHLAAHPLLLLETSFVFRRVFDAACRLAGFEPRVAFESRTPHVLLAMAEHGHGIAIVPSALKTQRYDLRLLGVSYQGKLLSEPLAVFWNSRRPLPRYAVAFCAMLAQYVQAAFPISRPSASV